MIASLLAAAALPMTIDARDESGAADPVLASAVERALVADGRTVRVSPCAECLHLSLKPEREVLRVEVRAGSRVAARHVARRGSSFAEGRSLALEALALAAKVEAAVVPAHAPPRTSDAISPGKSAESAPAPVEPAPAVDVPLPRDRPAEPAPEPPPAPEAAAVDAAPPIAKAPAETAVSASPAPPPRLDRQQQRVLDVMTPPPTPHLAVSLGGGIVSIPSDDAPWSWQLVGGLRVPLGEAWSVALRADVTAATHTSQVHGEGLAFKHDQAALAASRALGDWRVGAGLDVALLRLYSFPTETGSKLERLQPSPGLLGSVEHRWSVGRLALLAAAHVTWHRPLPDWAPFDLPQIPFPTVSGGISLGLEAIAF